VFSVQEPDGKFTITIEEPLRFTPGASKREAAMQATRDYAQIVDRYIRRYPEQWRGWNRYVHEQPASDDARPA
jgi:lauroyl/myristoyl acyltransferase